MSPAADVSHHTHVSPSDTLSADDMMGGRLRRTGIEVVGDVPWGAHFCQFYETAGDLVDTLVPYFREGLAANEFCMWVTSAPLEVEAAARSLRASVPDLDERIARGQIEILDYRDWYVRDGQFDAETVLRGWLDKLNDARRRGFEGLRLTGNTFWLEEARWDDFYRYEEMINDVIGQHRMLAVCTYSLAMCGAKEIVDVIDNHEFALIKRGGRWEILKSAIPKRAEEALQESEGRFRSLFASMNEGVAVHELVYDADGRPVDYRIVDANPAFEKNTSIPVERATGALASRLYGVEEPPFFEIYRRVAETGEPTSFTEYFAPLDRHFRISVVSTKPGTFATIFQDVTEIRRAEAALQEFAAELQRSNEDLERFAYVASHDLQEPLRSIISFSQLLERRYRGRLDEDGNDYIDFIVEGGTRMQAQIKDLLALSRVATTGRTPEATDAGAVLGEVLRDLTGTIEASGAAIEVGPMPVVMADQAQLGQVFANLIGNALKYRRADVPPHVRIAAERTGHLWQFTVTDNGIGIDPEYHDRVFVIFQRLHTREEYDGTGIGLAIVKRIVERHGGRIRVESAPGEGSTFFFTMAPA
ncbi:MAG: MEDS domain-containing protein [Methanospirillum sp.]